jgi:hypothetical protein
MEVLETFKKLQMIDIRQSVLWKIFADIKGWKTEQLKSADGKDKLQALIIPLGIFGLNMLKLQRSEKDPDWTELKKIIRRNRVATSILEPIKIESSEQYKKNRFYLSNFPYLATKSVVVDLTPGEKVLWRNLSENTKRIIKKNNEVEIKEVSPAIFLENWKRSSKIWTLKLPELEEIKRKMKDKSLFLLSFKKGVCQSGILLMLTKDTANYYHSFTSEEGRISGAHFKLVWEVMLLAKKRDKKYLDLEGTYDPRWPQKKWIGFTQFKKKFGGTEITYPGCFHRWF